MSTNLDEDHDLEVPSPIDDEMEAKGFSFSTNFDAWKEPCFVKAAEEAGLKISIQSEAYNRWGEKLEDSTKSLYLPFDNDSTLIDRFWLRYKELEIAKEREIRLYKSTTLVESPDFKGNRVQLFIDYHRWQYSTCSIQRRVYMELSENGYSQVPDELLGIVLSRLEYGGFKATSNKAKKVG